MMKKHLKKLRHHKIAKHHKPKPPYQTLLRRIRKFAKEVIQKNVFSGIFVRTLLFTLLLVAGYYFLLLKPKLAIPNALAEADKALSVQYFNLIENRIAYTELTKLDPNSSNFEFEKEEVIAKIQKTNEEGLKKLENPPKLQIVFGFPNDTLNFINKDLNSAHASLLVKNKRIYEGQKTIIQKINDYDSTVSKLFSYNPQLDLGSLDPKKDKEEMLERIAKARNGLKSIQDSLKNNKENDQLHKEINNVLALLNNLEKSLQTGNYISSSKILNDLYNQFSEVKKEALRALQAIIRSPESVKLLTEQTNLILEYEFWFNKARSMK